MNDTPKRYLTEITESNLCSRYSNIKFTDEKFITGYKFITSLTGYS